MMCSAIDNPTSCKTHAAIHFLRAKNINATEIQHKLCAVYGQNVMREGIERQGCRIFKDE
jgi:hypothetical protein